MKCPKKANLERKYISGCQGLGVGRWEWLLMGTVCWSDSNVLELGSVEGCPTPNILKMTELYTLNGWTLWYVNKAVIKQ